jgi:hypothetical protein
VRGQPLDLADFSLKFLSNHDCAELPVESADSVELLMQQRNGRLIYAASGIE